jgi:cytochrome c5
MRGFIFRMSVQHGRVRLGYARFIAVLAIVCCSRVLSVSAASHQPGEFLDKIRGTKDEGEQIVQHFCSSCHAKKPLIELGAPKIHQMSDWKPRLAQGLDNLLRHTEEGYGAMPARGGCFECSDEQLKLAVQALLPQSLQK